MGKNEGRKTNYQSEVYIYHKYGKPSTYFPVTRREVPWLKCGEGGTSSSKLTKAPEATVAIQARERASSSSLPTN